MIGYYAHHEGRAHLDRVLTLARALDEPVTVLSSRPRPGGSTVDWLLLPMSAESDGPHLESSPLSAVDYREHLSRVAHWLDEFRPSVLVIDVSVQHAVDVTVEVAALAQLLAIPVATVLAPGRRDDATQRRGFELSDTLIAPWPKLAEPIIRGLDADDSTRVRHIGAVSRLPIGASPLSPRRHRRVLLLDPHVSAICDEKIASARASTFGWSWAIARHGVWHRDTMRLLDAADVVVCHASQDVLAEVAARRRPAIVIPRERPHEEELCTAEALRREPWPAVVNWSFPGAGWRDLLEEAARLDGDAWTPWCDGRGAHRFAETLRDVAA